MAKAVRQPGPGAQYFNVLLKDADRVTEKVGWFESAKYPNGTPIALVAAVQEFGWPEKNIPPRLGMRATAEEQRAEWDQIMAAGSRRVLAGTLSVVNLFGLVGLKVAGDMRKHITRVFSPPLKPATVEARLRATAGGRAAQAGTKAIPITIAKPLVASGHLLATLTNVTETK